MGSNPARFWGNNSAVHLFGSELIEPDLPQTAQPGNHFFRPQQTVCGTWLKTLHWWRKVGKDRSRRKKSRSRQELNPQPHDYQPHALNRCTTTTARDRVRFDKMFTSELLYNKLKAPKGSISLNEPNHGITSRLKIAPFQCTTWMSRPLPSIQSFFRKLQSVVNALKRLGENSKL